MIAKRSQRGEVIFLEDILRVERSTQVYPMKLPNRQQSFFPRLRGRTTQGVAVFFFLLRRLEQPDTNCTVLDITAGLLSKMP